MMFFTYDADSHDDTIQWEAILNDLVYYQRYPLAGVIPDSVVEQAPVLNWDDYMKWLATHDKQNLPSVFVKRTNGTWTLSKYEIYNEYMPDKFIVTWEVEPNRYRTMNHTSQYVRMPQVFVDLLDLLTRKRKAYEALAE